LSRSFFRIGHKVRRKLVTAVFSTGFRSRVLSKALSRKIQRILVLCHGNVCRSPLAEAYLRHRLKAGTDGVEVSSAGLETEKGRSAHPLAVHVAEQAGLSLGAHSSTPVDRGQIDEADLILVMEDSQMDQVLQRFPSAKHKTIPLGYFSRGLPFDISDPYFGTLEDFKACYKAIQINCDELLSYLFRNEPRSSRCI
jgi:protein-tyrosine phosphatase